MKLGQIIDAMFAVRKQRTKLSTEDKTLKDEYNLFEGQVIDILENNDIIQSKAKTATATITESDYCIVEDWNALDAWILETGHLHLLERRVSVTSFRELIASGTKVPGVRAESKKTLSLRTI